MKWNFFIPLSIAIFFALRTAAGDTINIEIKDKVTLPEKQITLGDIAYVSCNNPSLLEKINNILIGNTPWPGNVRKIERDVLNARLMDEGINLNNVTYGSTTASLISVESMTITGEEILKTAREYLLPKLSRQESEIIIESDRPPKDKLLPASEGNVHFEISQIDSNKNRGNVQLIVRIFIDDKQYLKVPVFFNIRVYEDIVISNRKIDRYDTLNLDNLTIQRMDTTKLAGLTFVSKEDLIGKRAVRAIQPNTPITADIVDNPPAIKKGDFIKVFVQTGNLHVVTKGVAKEDGYLGKIIRIKNIDSNKELYGKVEDSTSVKIVF
ncbi:MAG: flagellar basal body P-ring formation chaperone FlgA [Candidatus Brocadia sp.]|nr:flagellar basal body P-ring formation chaperone FlgA [Candidatus Brocadia sp.]